MKGRLVAIPICLLSLSGCQLLTGCTYEERHITAGGAIVESGTELVSADVTVSAVRGSLSWKSLDRTILGNSLKGHVSSIALIRSDDPAALRFAVPIDEAFSPYVSSGGLIQRPGDVSPELGGLYEIIAANLGVLEITTDLPERPRMLLPLTVSGGTDWFRPDNCF